MLLGLRFIQGIGAAATRVIAVSIMRDMFGGRRMAEVMSLIFMVFMVIPVIAPGIGQFIMLFSELAHDLHLHGGRCADGDVGLVAAAPARNACIPNTAGR